MKKGLQILVIAFICLFGILGHLTLPSAQAQNTDNCQTWENVLEIYSQLDETDFLNSALTLQELILQLEGMSSKLPETAQVNSALMAMVYFKASSLLSSDPDLKNAATEWENLAIQREGIARQLVNQSCAGSPPLMIADFDSCQPPNNLGGNTGSYAERPNSLSDTHVSGVIEPGCVIKLEYAVEQFATFWLQLRDADFSPYTTLEFDIRADLPAPQQIKIELKRADSTEWVIAYVGNITDQWQTKQVAFSSFDPTPFAQALSYLTDMEELVFTFEKATAGESGVVYLDNIRVVP